MKSAAVLLLLCAPARAADDLSSVVAAAVSRSPEVARAQAARRQAEAAQHEATMNRLPKLSADGAVLRSDDPLFAFGTLLEERRVAASDFAPPALNQPGYQTAVLGGVQIGLPLFSGFAISRAHEEAGLAAKEAEALGGAATQGVRLRTIDAYLAGLRDRALLKELDERIASSESEIASAERLKKSGLILGSDHQAALAVLAGLKARRAQAQAEKNAHDAQLAALLGGAAPDPEGSLSPWAAPVADDAELVAAALAARPDLRAAGLRRDRAGVRERGAAQSLLPVVDAFASLQTTGDGLDNGAGARMFGLRASVPFGDPAYFSRRDRAHAETEGAAQARAALEDAVRSEVTAQAAAVRGVTAAAAEIDESLARARESLVEVRPLYREGRQSIMEVLRAEEAAAKLAEASLDARRRERTEWAALRAAQGLLDDGSVTAIAHSLEETR